MAIDQFLTDYDVEEIVVRLRPKSVSPGPGPGPLPPPSLAVVDWVTYQTPDLTLPLPAGSPWRARADVLPAHPQSAAFIAALKTLDSRVHPHPLFGVGSNGIPVQLVPAGTPGTPVSFRYAAESDPGPYPLPSSVVKEDAADGHWIGWKESAGSLFEISVLQQGAAGWSGDAGAIFDLDVSNPRPSAQPGWTSADAAGLPIMPGLVRYQEVAAGLVPHKLRLTVGRTRHAYLPPATHYASSLTALDLLPMGAVIRLSSAYDISGLGPQAHVVAQCLKDYGGYVADNGSTPFVGVCGTPDSRWDDSDLGTMKRIPIDAFEVVAWSDADLVTQA